MVTRRVLAENCFGTWSSVNAQELGAGGHTGIRADLEIRAHAPRGNASDRTVRGSSVCHSYRNARIGSTRAPRTAGISTAPRLTPPNSNSTPT